MFPSLFVPPCQVVLTFFYSGLSPQAIEFLAYLVGGTKELRKKGTRPNDLGLLGGRNPQPGGAIAILILTLKEDEKIHIGDKITVMVVEIRGKQNRLGIKALARVPIYER